MKNAYPIIMSKGKENIVVYIPDFNINTQGKNITEAIEMARDAIGLIGIDMEDDGEKLPTPSSLEVIQAQTQSNDIISLVDVDFTEYRKKNDMRTVKKNCTLPCWLNYETEKANINFSQVLQQAIINKLNLSHRA